VLCATTWDPRPPTRVVAGGRTLDPGDSVNGGHYEADGVSVDRPV
jgi:hypothetical protein